MTPPWASSVAAVVRDGVSTIIGNNELGTSTRPVAVSGQLLVQRSAPLGDPGWSFLPRDEPAVVEAGGTQVTEPGIYRVFLQFDTIRFGGLEPVAGTNIVAGRALDGTSMSSTTSTLWGYHVNSCEICAMTTAPVSYMNLLFGFRQVGLDESLGITENLTRWLPVPRLETPGDMIMVSDRFSTSNRFYGGKIGLAGQYRFGDAVLGLLGSRSLLVPPRRSSISRVLLPSADRTVRHRPLRAACWPWRERTSAATSHNLSV